MVRWNIDIEDSELLDDNAALIGKTRVAEALRIGKSTERLLGIIANGGDLYAVFLEALTRLFQLNELATAVRSPIRAAREDEQKALMPDQVAKVSLLAVLVR